MTTLDGLMFWVADVPATVEFYEEAFGLKRRWVREEGDYAMMETGAVTLQFAVESAAPGMPCLQKKDPTIEFTLHPDGTFDSNAHP